jgi:DNA-binding FrmR family transcriptional regulator
VEVIEVVGTEEVVGRLRKIEGQVTGIRHGYPEDAGRDPALS